MAQRTGHVLADLSEALKHIRNCFKELLADLDTSYNPAFVRRRTHYKRQGSSSLVMVCFQTEHAAARRTIDKAAIIYSWLHFLPAVQLFLPHYCRSVLFWKAWTVFHLVDRCNRYLTCRAHQCIHGWAALQSQALCLLCGRSCFVCVCCWWCQLPLLLRRDPAECFSLTSVCVSLLLSFSHSGQLSFWDCFL